MARRRGWIPSALAIAALVPVIADQVIFSPQRAAPSPDYIFIDAFVGFAIVFALFSGYSAMRSADRLSPLRGRLKEVAFAAFRPILLLDNGIVVSSARTTMFTTLLIAPDGSVLRPHAKEALRWKGLRGTRRVAMIFPGATASPDAAELQALGSRIGARMTGVVVREPKQQFLDAPNPRWIVTLLLFSPIFSPPNVERFTIELDAIEAFLRRVVRPSLPIAGPTPSVAGAAPSVVRPTTVGFWNRFRRTAPAFQRLVGLTLLLSAVVVIGEALQGLAALLILMVLLGGGGLIGTSARTRRDGFAGGLIFGWAGWFLGILVWFPVTAGLQSGLLGVGVGILVGLVAGFFFGIVTGLIGGTAGYVGARLAKRPVRA